MEEEKHREIGRRKNRPWMIVRCSRAVWDAISSTCSDRFESAGILPSAMNMGEVFADWFPGAKNRDMQAQAKLANKVNNAVGCGTQIIVVGVILILLGLEVHKNELLPWQKNFLKSVEELFNGDPNSAPPVRPNWQDGQWD